MSNVEQKLQAMGLKLPACPGAGSQHIFRCRRRET